MLLDPSHKPHKHLELPQMSLNTFLAASPHVLESAPLSSLPLPHPLSPRDDDVATCSDNATTTTTTLCLPRHRPRLVLTHLSRRRRA
jgi:hypothetical protein